MITAIINYAVLVIVVLAFLAGSFGSLFMIWQGIRESMRGRAGDAYSTHASAQPGSIGPPLPAATEEEAEAKRRKAWDLLHEPRRLPATRPENVRSLRTLGRYRRLGKLGDP
jgi:hypothetical protein